MESLGEKHVNKMDVGYKETPLTEETLKSLTEAQDQKKSGKFNGLAAPGEASGPMQKFDVFNRGLVPARTKKLAALKASSGGKPAVAGFPNPPAIKLKNNLANKYFGYLARCEGKFCV